ncbi:flagellin hook IN motif-containing protein [Campylobacter upsaliensis]|uniref:flagellin N-terminal helical domain-containing protein n=1 Tax=Campylobacter upsaliensis TaxID=28080 RepID=UPI0022EB1FE6|nr:flagellin hook IN motif-containing protein [Campylobacter upsaliensis]
MRITNIAALSAYTSVKSNSSALSASLQRLSSGLRINSAKDDASSSAISSQLLSSSHTLNQANNNANDAKAMFQIADKAMDEQIKIVEMIKVKATQAAQDGQSAKTRRMIQADINRLLEAYDNIANTTSYNGIQLLSGGFINKKFQIGAQANQVVGASIGSTLSSKVGNTRFETGANIVAGNYGSIDVKINSTINNKTFTFSGVEIGTKLNYGLGDLVERINNVSTQTGIKASYDVRTVGTDNITAGKTGADFSINGTLIGSISVQDNDKNGALVQAINAVKTTTGVEASINAAGNLELNSLDGRGIVLKDSSNGFFGLAHLRNGQSVQAKLEDFKPITTADGVKINDINVGPAATPEALVSNVNALTPQTGVSAKIQDGVILFMALDPTKRLNMSGNQVTPNLGVPLTTVRGDWVTKDKFITRMPNPTHPEYNGIAIQVIKKGSAQKVYTERTILEGKADGKYYLQDLVDCFNKDSHKTGITAFIEENPNDPNQQRICFTMPDDVEAITGISTHNYPNTQNPPQQNTGGAQEFGFGGSKQRNADGAKLTSFNENFGRLKLVSSGPKDIQMQVKLNNVEINSLLGFDASMTGFAEENVSLRDMKGLMSSAQENALGFFHSIFDTYIDGREGLHLKKAMALMDVADTALENLDSIRSDLGSVQQQLDATINNISITEISLSAAASQLKDVDFAAESANFSKSQLLTEFSSAMLYNAMKVKEENILSLLV